MALPGNSRFRAIVAAAMRRLSMLLITVLASALVSGALVSMAPGLGTDERQLDLRLSEASLAAVRSPVGSPEMARGSPGFTTFLAGQWRYVRDLAKGDWGVSISLGRPVRELVFDRAGLTLRTLAAGLTLSWGLSFGLSLTLQGLDRHALDRVATLAAGGLLCLPAAIVAMLFLYLDLGPALALAAVLSPRLFRYVRNILSAAARRPHVLAARARGTGNLALVWRHVSIPAAPELLALAGISASMAIGAVIPVETLCGSPGIGQLVWLSAMARDLPVLIHLTALVAAATAIANLFADIARSLVAREI